MASTWHGGAGQTNLHERAIVAASVKTGCLTADSARIHRSSITMLERRRKFPFSPVGWTILQKGL
jgi:hypothetical protein